MNSRSFKTCEVSADSHMTISSSEKIIQDVQGIGSGRGRDAGRPKGTPGNLLINEVDQSQRSSQNFFSPNRLPVPFTSCSQGTTDAAKSAGMSEDRAALNMIYIDSF